MIEFRTISIIRYKSQYGLIPNPTRNERTIYLFPFDSTW